MIKVGFDLCDPTKEIQVAWAVKERLRMLLAESEPSRIRWRLADFYSAAVDAQLPEATRLASTISTWWPAVLIALTHDVTNARTEGFNRIIKQTKRVGCGYNGAPLELAGRVAVEDVLLFENDPSARVHWVARTQDLLRRTTSDRAQSS